MSATGIPQLAVVLGSCTAGGAYVPAMSDESIIVQKNGTIFLAGPPLVKAATQEVVSAEDLGGAEVHTSISGVADHFAQDEPSALSKVRQIVGALPSDPNSLGSLPRNISSYVEEPLYSLSDLHSIIPEDNRIPFDVRQILARVLDGSRFHESVLFSTCSLHTFGCFSFFAYVPFSILGSRKSLANPWCVDSERFMAYPLAS